jgi:glucan phosphoethanolaminetransferase (alkaline phosphatase superfamily)
MIILRDIVALLAILFATVGTIYVPFIVLIGTLNSPRFPIIIFLSFVTYSWCITPEKYSTKIQSKKQIISLFSNSNINNSDFYNLCLVGVGSTYQYLIENIL